MRKNRTTEKTSADCLTTGYAMNYNAQVGFLPGATITKEEAHMPQLIKSLKTYKKEYILSDLMAGLMVAIIALPLSIALGIQSVPQSVSANGIGYGIVTAIIAGFLISAFGGSPYQIGGPTAAFVVILFGYLSNPDIGLIGLALSGAAAGVLLILLGILKAGNVMKFFPYPITIGFTTGIGITLILGQVKDFFGLTVSPCSALGIEALNNGGVGKLIGIIGGIGSFNVATAIVAACGLACVIFLPKLSKKIPASFVALIVCTLLTLLLNECFGASVATIGSRYGDIKAGFELPDFSSVKDIKLGSLIVPTLVITFLCAIESLLSATVAAGMTGTTFDANQELIGQGIANIGSSLLGGLPATGAIARTAAGIENGAKSPICGMTHAVVILIMYFALMGVMKFVPLAVFAAILVSVAINMSRFRLFAKLAAFGKRDTAILIVTCLLTVVLDLTYGVIGGIALALILNVKSFKKGLSVTQEEGTIKVKGSVFFVNYSRFMKAIEATSACENVIIDLTDVYSIDESSLEKLGSVIKKIRNDAKTVQVIGAKNSVKNHVDKYLEHFSK